MNKKQKICSDVMFPFADLVKVYASVVIKLKKEYLYVHVIFISYFQVGDMGNSETGNPELRRIILQFDEIFLYFEHIHVTLNKVVT